MIKFSKLIVLIFLAMVAMSSSAQASTLTFNDSRIDGQIFIFPGTQYSFTADKSLELGHSKLYWGNNFLEEGNAYFLSGHDISINSENSIYGITGISLYESSNLIQNKTFFTLDRFNPTYYITFNTFPFSDPYTLDVINTNESIDFYLNKTTYKDGNTSIILDTKGDRSIISIIPVPEPSSLLLGLMGIIGMSGLRRQRAVS